MGRDKAQGKDVGGKETEILTPWAERIAMNLVYPVLDSNLFCEQDHRSFGRTIGTRTRLQAHQAQHRGRVYNPSSVARGMEILRQELRDGIFAAKKDRAGIDIPGKESR